MSEAAASVVDRHLQLNVVPRTEIVLLSSPAFGTFIQLDNIHFLINGS